MRRLLGLAFALCLAAPARAGLPDGGFSSATDNIAEIFARAGARDATAVRGRQVQPPIRGVMGHGRAQFEALDSGLTPPDVSRYAVRGADISHYQGAIDWGKVKNAKLSFVVMKATEGGDFVDDTFAKNWKGADSIGLPKGAYHFYNFCRDGKSQAANFIKTVPVEAGALPPTLDLEESDDCAKMPPKAAFRKDLSDWVEAVEKAYGQTPILYINYGIYARYLKGENDPYKLWIADISHAAPSLPDWALWQYGWHGHIDGMEGEVDLDVFNGTLTQLAELQRPSRVMFAAAR